jgi:hypothetical protein
MFLRRNLLAASMAAASVAVIGRMVYGKASAAHKAEIPRVRYKPVQKCYVFPLWTVSSFINMFSFVSICPNIESNGLYVAETLISKDLVGVSAEPIDLSNFGRKIPINIIRLMESAHKEALDSRCSCTGLHEVHSLEFYGKPHYNLQKIFDLYGKALFERVIRVPLTVPCELI